MGTAKGWILPGPSETGRGEGNFQKQCISAMKQCFPAEYYSAGNFSACSDY